MAVTLAQAVVGEWTSGATVSATLTTTAGNLLVFAASSCSASSIDTWNGVSEGTSIDALTYNVSGQLVHVETFYTENITGGSRTVTLNLTGGSQTDGAVIVHEYAGCATSSSLDQHAAQNQADPGTTADAVKAHATGVTTTTN